MPAIRNSLPLNLGNIAIQPAVSSTTTPTANISTNTTTVSSPTPSVPVSSTANFANSIGVPTVSTAVTSTNVSTFANSNLIGLPQSLSRLSPSVLSPIVALQRTARPFISAPVIFRGRQTPLYRLANQGALQDETLSLRVHTYVNGQAVQDVATIRCDLISLVNFTPIYDFRGLTLSPFGQYLDDLYQSSLIRDTLRKYLLINKSIATPQFNNTLATISNQVNNDINSVSRTIQTIDGLIQKIKEINNILDVKNNLDTKAVVPNQGLRSFFTERMLFAEQAYNIFSDTKVLYQLLFDLNGILEKCSFNLIDNFTDSERSVFVSDPLTIRKQTIQDSITLDLSYGDNLKYTPEAIRGKFITNYVTFNSILNALPATSTNRFKFLINLLSKELRVSKGLGKYNLPEANFFGFLKQGNPFESVLGTVPSDIFIAPLGQNSLSSLFYIKTGTSNVVVLPFESRQVAGDGETVFVPGTIYFSDGILNGNFAAFTSYTESFSERTTKAYTVFNKLLLQQAADDDTSRDLQPTAMLKHALTLFGSTLDLVRTNNNDATNLLSFVLMLLGNGSPNIKFEVYKLFLLLIVYDTRNVVTTAVPEVDNFRNMLLGEISSQTIQGFSQPLTESNLPTLIANQIEIVKQLLLKNIQPTFQERIINGLSHSTTTALRNARQRLALGRHQSTPSPQNRNPSNNSAQVQVEQFSRLIYSLRVGSENNLFKSVVTFAKQLFSASSTNDRAYHLSDSSSVTRYHGLSMSGFVLMAFEIFSCLVDQFAKENIAYHIINGAGGTQDNSKYINITFIGNSIRNVVHDINMFNQSSTVNNPIINDYYQKLTQEDQIIDNILSFFSQLNNRFSSIVTTTTAEQNALAAMQTINPNSLSSTRTAKGTLQQIIDKKAVYNPNNNAALDFYLPSGKAVSDRNWLALKNALNDSNFLNGRKKLVTVGIPYGFINSALGARLTKDEVYNGQLNQEASDLVNVRIYKLDKNDEGIIYKPQTFKFDLSLFPRGFESYDMQTLQDKTYSALQGLFQLYDFDETTPRNQVTPKTISEFIANSEYYNASVDRQTTGTEVGQNLCNSFLLDLYLHMLTGLNVSEETFISYTEEESKQFVSEMKKITKGTADLTKVKLMSSVYRELLAAFPDQDEAKLMLTLCNDIQQTVMRKKDYDRTFNILLDIDKFAIDTNTMSQTNEGQNILEILHKHEKTYTDPLTGELYKSPENFVLDEYFINVEIVR